MEYFKKRGMSVGHNIRPPTATANRIGRVYKLIVNTLGGYAGDLAWLAGAVDEIRSAKALLVYSDRLALPLCYLRMLHMLPRCPTVYISMGLPEKLRAFKRMGMLRSVMQEFKTFASIICLSKCEADVLESEFSLQNNVFFLPAGVDTEYFAPMQKQQDIDVLSIGADPFRDFVTLLGAAKRLPSRKFRIITRAATAEGFGAVPRNVEVLTDIPMSAIREHMASSRCVALPVRDNTYSGATTVLLQAMSMAKPVIANNVAANKDGYGFADGKNCVYVSVADVESLSKAIERLLANDESSREIGAAAREHVVAALSLELFHEKLFRQVQSVTGSAANANS